MTQPSTPKASQYSRTNPFPGKLLVNRSLCGQGSDKDTRHFEIDLTGSGVSYEVGDSMTIWIDPATQMMRRVEIKTLYDKKPATLIADYRAVPNGPTYMARAVLTYPEKNVELTVDNSGYERSTP